VDRHALAEERSIALHRAVADRLRRDLRIVVRARERVHAWRASGAVHERYIGGWEEVLSLPVDELCNRLVDRSESMRALRQVSVFAGVLDARERWRIYKGQS
jgi:hypothetical protein